VRLYYAVYSLYNNLFREENGENLKPNIPIYFYLLGMPTI